MSCTYTRTVHSLVIHVMQTHTHEYTCGSIHQVNQLQYTISECACVRDRYTHRYTLPIHTTATHTATHRRIAHTVTCCDDVNGVCGVWRIQQCIVHGVVGIAQGARVTRCGVCALESLPAALCMSVCGLVYCVAACIT